VDSHSHCPLPSPQVPTNHQAIKKYNKILPLKKNNSFSIGNSFLGNNEYRNFSTISLNLINNSQLINLLFSMYFDVCIHERCLGEIIIFRVCNFLYEDCLLEGLVEITTSSLVLGGFGRIRCLVISATVLSCTE